MKIAQLASGALLLLLIPCAAGKECDGVLQGDSGDFEYTRRSGAPRQPRSCIWLIQTYSDNTCFMLKSLDSAGNTSAILYPELTSGAVNLQPFLLSDKDVGSTFNITGTSMVILPHANSSLSFSWDSTPKAAIFLDDSATFVNYINAPAGRLTWCPRRARESVCWVIGVGQSAEDLVKYKIQADLADCDRNNPCACFSFKVFEVSTEGYLVEVVRVCGRLYSNGSFQTQSYPLVITASASTGRQDGVSVELQWMPGPFSRTESPHEQYGIGGEIYFTTDGGGIKVYSTGSNTVKTIVNSTEDLEGLAFDPVRNQIYYGSFDKIYRADNDGTNVKIVFTATGYRNIEGLAVDWITGNLYGVSENGHVFVCETLQSGMLSCENLITGQGNIQGIALDPNNGMMYWARWAGDITRAQMDGSDRVQIVTGLGTPIGLAIDYDGSRLFWAEFSGNRVCSSKLDGSDIRTIVQLAAGVGPCGIALHGNRIYWGNYYGMSVQSSLKSGQNMKILYKGTTYVQHMAAATRNLSATRPNPCEGRYCANICVLTVTSFRCGQIT